MPEDLQIKITTQGARQAAAEVKQVDSSVAAVTPAANATAEAIEKMNKRMADFSRISGIVAGATAIIATLRKIAQAIDAVVASLNRSTEDIRVGNLTARVERIADAYARLTAEIDRTARAQADFAGRRQSSIQTTLERKEAYVDREAAQAIQADPDRRDEILADAARQKVFFRREALERATTTAGTALDAREVAAMQRRDAARETQERSTAEIAEAGRRRAAINQEIRYDTDRVNLLSGKYTRASRHAEAVQKHEPQLKKVDDAAAKAIAAAQKALAEEEAAQRELDSIAAERNNIRKTHEARLWQLEAEEIAAKMALEAALAPAEDEEARRAAEAAARAAARAASDIAGVNASAADQIDSISVDAPRSASSYGAVGGIIGNQIIDAERLRDQRAAALEAIQREQTTLLNEIKLRLSE